MKTTEIVEMKFSDDADGYRQIREMRRKHPGTYCAITPMLDGTVRLVIADDRFAISEKYGVSPIQILRNTSPAEREDIVKGYVGIPISRFGGVAYGPELLPCDFMEDSDE
ncbi:MAG TPA: hypothetical protein PK395_16975 [bacterium]|nr:hypothetical protein [bacterium]HQQ00759.1 hypothetical protein [bacterium]